MKLSIPLLAAILLSACGAKGPVGPSGSGGGDGTGGGTGGGTAAGGGPAREVALTLSPELVATGGEVLVMRMRADAALVMEAQRVAPGSTTLTLSTPNGELLGVVERAARRVVRSRVEQPGCAPAPASSGVVHRVPQDFATIQAAVDAASPGDEVLVGPGEFTEFIVLRSGIALRGSGGGQTVLDAKGAAMNLIDFTNAAHVSISGFTFRGVGLASTCGHDVLGCSGNWYAAAIYGDGHEYQVLPTTTGGEPTVCPGSSAFISHNVFEGNSIAVMPYFHAIALVQNNLFVGNAHSYVGTHLQDRGVVINNTFVDSAQNAIAISAGYVDVVNNVLVNSFGNAMVQEYIQRGRVRTNLLFGRDPARQLALVIGQDGNVEADPLFVDPANRDYRLGPGSPGIDVGTELDADGSPADLGAWGGAGGQW